MPIDFWCKREIEPQDNRCCDANGPIIYCKIVINGTQNQLSQVTLEF